MKNSAPTAFAKATTSLAEASVEAERRRFLQRGEAARSCSREAANLPVLYNEVLQLAG